MFDWIIAKLNVTLGGNEVPETDPHPHPHPNPSPNPNPNP